MSVIPKPDTLGRLRDEVQRRLSRYLLDLETIVNIESGSYTKAGVDQVATWMADRLAALGATIERHPHDEYGDTVVATLAREAPGASVLLVGHSDTVFEPGYLARRPYEVRTDEILGPGVSDMKSGLLVGLHAMEALRALDGDDWLPVRRLVYVINPDEEIGSPLSSALIAELAQGADVAFVMEAARENGDIVSARKGMMHIRATIHGRAAHSGVEPHKGRSATLEAAHKTVALHQLNGRWPGVTVNVGEIAGGTRPNIVAQDCLITIDMRARLRAEQDEAEAAIYEILQTPTVPDIATEIERLAHFPPMERTTASAELVHTASEIAALLGFDLKDAETGGSSDANTTSAVGVPSIDGLGPIGGNDHTPSEYIVKSSIVPRTTLLAALVLSVGD